MTDELSPYVLFREHPNTHKEIYLAGVHPLSHVVSHTNYADCALRFATAADGYHFGAVWGLGKWQVGRR
jgi:hypothetical protein